MADQIAALAIYGKFYEEYLATSALGRDEIPFFNALSDNANLALDILGTIAGGIAGKKIFESSTSQGLRYNFDSKIAKQIEKRGWSTESISDTFNNPAKTIKTVDSRRNPQTGSKK